MSTIILDEDEARCFVWGDYEGFEEVETVVDHDSGYKDMAPATTIGRRISDNTFWELCWDQHTAHYSDGEHMFNDNVLHQVEQVTETIVIKTWKRV